MGQIGRWIDEKCRTEPEVMRRVLNRKFGNLELYLDGHDCGCLVGSYALVKGEAWTTLRQGHAAPPEGRDAAVGVAVAELTDYRGCSTEHACERKRPDAFVIRLLKQRIWRALGLSMVEHDETAQESSEQPNLQGADPAEAREK